MNKLTKNVVNFKLNLMKKTKQFMKFTEIIKIQYYKNLIIVFGTN